MSESLPYPKFDENKKVVCQICGKAFLVISPKHLSRIHGVTLAQYRTRYPDAPLSSEEFRSRGKFGKLHLFKKEDERKRKGKPATEDIITDGEPLVEELKELELEESKKLESEELEEIPEVIIKLPEDKQDPISRAKNKILKFLKEIFSNVESNYIIRIFAPDGRLECEFISDFADPILKIDFEFPRAFWHNEDRYFDLARNVKLRNNGWKVIEVNSNNPSIGDLIKATELIN